MNEFHFVPYVPNYQHDLTLEMESQLDHSDDLPSPMQI